jgi:hypothetical protein
VRVPQFTLLSTSDTDLLSARAGGAPWRLGNPARLDDADIAALVEGSALVVVRLLGMRRQFEELLAPLLAGPAPVVVLGGEQLPDAELMELSTVPIGVATDAHAYLEKHSWAHYGAWHLALSEGANEETKARYAFVYGDFRRVHRMGIIACHYRAAEWGHKEIELAAHDLLQLLDATRA